MALQDTDPFSPWLSRLIGRLPGTTEAEIREELEYTIKDFCREGEPWQEVVGPYNIKAGDPIITINPIDGKRVGIYVKTVWKEQTQLQQISANVPTVSATGSPKYFTCESDPAVITLLPVPDTNEAKVVKALVSLCPKCPDKWLPSWFASHFFEAIYDGVLSRFYSQIEKPYSDTTTAGYHLRKYRSRCKEARIMANKGHTIEAPRWRFNEFGR